MRARAARAHAAWVRRSLPALAAVLAAGSVFASAGPAAADAGALVPGRSQTVVINVPAERPKNWAEEAASVTVTVTGLRQAENGCLDPEKEAGDDCSSDLGELAEQLDVAVIWGIKAGADCDPRSGVATMALAVGQSATFNEVEGVECLRLELTFRDTGPDDNVAQSDTMEFDLDLVAEGLPDPVPTGGTGTAVQTDPGRSGTAGSNGGAQNSDRRGAAARAANGAGAGQGPAAAAPAVPATPAGEVVAEAPAGPVLDRVGARVSVDADGTDVQTQAADTSIQGLVLTWGSLLLGAIALGWAGFVLVARRRKRSAA